MNTKLGIDNTHLPFNNPMNPYHGLSVGWALQGSKLMTLYCSDILAAIMAHAILYPKDDHVQTAHRLNVTPEYITEIMSKDEFLYLFSYRTKLSELFKKHQLFISVVNSVNNESELIHTLPLLKITLSRLQRKAFELMPNEVQVVLNHIQSYPHHVEGKIAACTNLHPIIVNAILNDYLLTSVEVRRNYAFFKRLEAPNHTYPRNIDEITILDFIKKQQAAGYGKARIGALLEKELGISKQEISIRNFMNRPLSQAMSDTSIVTNPLTTPSATDQPLRYGPVINANLTEKLGGHNEVVLSRLPGSKLGASGWSLLLNVIQPRVSANVASCTRSAGQAALQHSVSDHWQHLGSRALTLYEESLYLEISPATLMTLFAVTNARSVASYSDSRGYRATYPSYCGQWNITHRDGKPCIVSLNQHKSHSVEKVIYPSQLPIRVDKCIEMLAGIISDESGWKLAFSGSAKGKGPLLLQERKKGFPGTHGSRHLYNMMGGKVSDVDFLHLETYEKDKQSEGARKLEVDFLGHQMNQSFVFVPKYEETLLAHALDSLPWSHLSWSIHRGLKDILLAYGKPIMYQYGRQFAGQVKSIVQGEGDALVKKGWNAEFVAGSMGDAAESFILMGGGNSGDLVRVIVAIIEAMLEASQQGRLINKDHTTFWTRTVKHNAVLELDSDAMIALTKIVVLASSEAMDYQLYHKLSSGYGVYLSQ